MDLRDVMYTKTRLRAPLTGQLSRRPLHRKKLAPSLEASVSSRAIRKRLVEGHLGSRHPLRVLRLTPPIGASVWSGAAHEKTALQRNGTRSALATNPDSISAVMTIGFVCRDREVNASILPLLYSDKPLPQLV
ncbi:HTH_Tnp_Tc3_2 domain-containing protein [Trichonephila clavipes]|nr:HTH_Tnp_Tc3_2 domain-containing protein [Trichonephila clavipes]